MRVPRLLPARLYGAAFVLAGVFACGPADAQPFESSFTAYLYHHDVGATGYGHGDLDGDGSEEIIFGSSLFFDDHTSSVWSVLHHVPERQTYEIVWQSLPYEDEITTVIVLVSTDFAPRIAVGLQSGNVEIFDGATLALLAVLENGAGPVTQVLQDDADNDGDSDLVVVTPAFTRLYDRGDLTPQGTVGYGATECRIGNVDADAALEIVYVNGRVVEQHGDGTVLQWDFSAGGFGGELELVDVDDDGMLEILATKGRGVRAYDADLAAVKWSRFAGIGVVTLTQADLAGDATPELVLGGEFDEFFVVDPATGTKMWSVLSVDHDINQVIVLDSDGDGDLELVWTAGLVSTAPDYLLIHDAHTGVQEFKSPTTHGPMWAVAAGDVDGDGKRDLVSASRFRDSYLGDGAVTVYDGRTYEPEWESPDGYFSSFAGDAIHDIALADLDGDGAQEILLGCDSFTGAALHVIDGRTQALLHSWYYPDADYLTSIVVGDVTGDGDVEIVSMAINGGTYDYSEASLQVIDADSGVLEWSTTLGGGYRNSPFGLGMANLDDDAAQEIVLLFNVMSVIDGLTRRVSFAAGIEFSAFTLQRTRKGRSSILAAGADGLLYRVRPGRPLRVLGQGCAGPTSAIAPLPARRAGLACDRRLSVFDLRSRTLTWSSDDFDSAIGVGDHLAVWRSGGSLHIAGGTETRVVVLTETEKDTDR